LENCSAFKSQSAGQSTAAWASSMSSVPNSDVAPAVA
jgi:hypothetical protein